MTKITKDKNIQFIKGVGPSKVQLLNKMGIETVKDMIEYYPRAYEDRTKICKIKDFVENKPCVFYATTVARPFHKQVRKGLSINKIQVSDATGVCEIAWFNQDYILNKLYPGQTYIIYGVPKFEFGKFKVENPIFYEGLDLGKVIGIYPKYPLIKKVTQNMIRSIAKTVLESKEEELEIFNEDFRKEHNLLTAEDAVQKIHLPKTLKDIDDARRRIVFEEFFTLQVALFMMKEQNFNEKKGVEFKDVEDSEFMKLIPFELTDAQKRVVKEIKEDMQSDKMTNRLVQGDVGSGKTIVAAIALYIAAKNGYQATMMAPTTILAIQHYEELRGYLEPLGMTVGLLTGNTTKKEKEIIKEKLQNGEIDVLIGTHAIIEDNVIFNNLALAIIDEQHRFGVKQRLKLINKGNAVDTIVMSATPIPRTLGLMIYGDMDISIIDELPKGRQKVNTYVVDESYELRLQNFIRKQIEAGNQVYVVCPLVEEDEEKEKESLETNKLVNVVKLAKEYKEEVFKEYNVDYLHGKMKNKEKDKIMEKFKNGETDILISTTVIEVGVNVPNATLMVIKNADRFGLAQLHQLRGRVGRGSDKSYCVLQSTNNNSDTIERLKIMQNSNDGFYIAEKDLGLRGPGDFFGTKQSGLPVFKLADLLEDVTILKEAATAAKKILEEDKHLDKEENKLLKSVINEKFFKDIVG